MKKLSIAFVLLFSASSANALTLPSLLKPKVIVPIVAIVTPPPAPTIVVTPPSSVTPPAPEQKVATVVPEQFIVIFTEETKQIINDIVNCVDEPNGGGHDNVSAVPVPAALPLMATALGIFGITRRRKAFK